MSNNGNGYYEKIRSLARVLSLQDCRFTIVQWAKSNTRAARQLSAALEEGAQASGSPPILFKAADVLAREAEA